MRPHDLDLTLTLTALGGRHASSHPRQAERSEARVTALAALFDISLNSVSKHIRMLERARLVRCRLAGREHFLSLNPAPVDEGAEWINEQRAFWSRRLAALDRLLPPQRQTLTERPRHEKGRRR
jgi:DNA-binding transcriptional ArsR family regulator